MSFWGRRSVLVTGATGLVGAALVKRLLAFGADIVCLVRDWTPQSEFVRAGLESKCRIVRGDVCDQAVLERALGEYEVRTVFHLAAQTIVGIANRNPISTFESNIQGTWTLLEACRRSPMVAEIVLASSDKAYGDQQVLPYTESTPLEGRHPYDVSKSCADLIATAYSVTYRTRLAITRCGNFYGPGDLNWNRIVPGTIRSVFSGERPVIRSDGKFVRDYFFVEDGAAAYTCLAEALADGDRAVGQAFNFSNEIQVTVLELVSKILRLMDSDLTPNVLNEATNEILHQCLSAEKAKQVLGWSPLFTLDEGLARTIEWYRACLAEPNR
ncbi:MAG: NAD-dependent epimerase/dehydratase family protein [Fimbriimonadaceae bacterium]